MTIQEIVLDEIKQVADEQKKALAPLDDEIELVSIGLDSLCFAILVARLEERLLVDPFSFETMKMPVTLGDFVGLYRDAPVDTAPKPRPTWAGRTV